MTSSFEPGGDKPVSEKSAREERLAARLRDNLRRRKAQARALGGSDVAPTDASGAPARPGSGLPKREDGG